MGRPVTVSKDKNIIGRAAVAQSVERLPCKQRVAGSSPVGGSTINQNEHKRGV